MTVYRHGRWWWYDFVINGARIRERTAAATRDEALHIEALRKAETSSTRCTMDPSKAHQSFRNFANGEFGTWCAVEHRARISTYARYMRSVKVLSVYFADQSLRSINAGRVEQFKMWRSQQKRKHARDGHFVTPAAVNRDLAVLRILFNYAMRLEIVNKNPVAQVRFFREKQNCMRVVSAEEEEQYLAAAAPLLKHVAILMLDTGMRPGEIYKLRKDDIDLTLRAVFVRSGKTANATRHIPLTERTYQVLAHRVEDAKTEWLFPCPFDSSLPVLDVRKAHDGAVRRAKISPPFRLYDLRHTALTRMAMAGIDLPTLKELAGHSQIQMTMRYVHPTPEHKRRAIEKFEHFRADDSNSIIKLRIRASLTSSPTDAAFAEREIAQQR